MPPLLRRISNAAHRLRPACAIGTRRCTAKKLRRLARKLAEGTGVCPVLVEFAVAGGHLVYGTPLRPRHTTREKIRAAISSFRFRRCG